MIEPRYKEIHFHKSFQKSILKTTDVSGSANSCLRPEQILIRYEWTMLSSTWSPGRCRCRSRCCPRSSVPRSPPWGWVWLCAPRPSKILIELTKHSIDLFDKQLSSLSVLRSTCLEFIPFPDKKPIFEINDLFLTTYNVEVIYHQ